MPQSRPQTDRAGCLTAILRALGFQAASAKQQYPYHTRDSIVTAAELNFYQVLRTVIREHYVICLQVPIQQLFFAKTGDRKQNAHYRGKISQKTVDFVLCDPRALRPLAAIELDDSSHQRSDRQQRDDFVENVFAAAKLPLIRVPVHSSYAPTDLRERLIQAGLNLDNYGESNERR